MKQGIAISLITVMAIAMILFGFSLFKKTNLEALDTETTDHLHSAQKSTRNDRIEDSKPSVDSTSLPQSRALNQAINRADAELFRSLMVKDKESTLSLLSKLANESNKAAVHTLLYTYSYEQGDWQDALNSLNHFEDLDSLHHQLVSDFFYEYAKVNYQEAGQWLSSHATDGKYSAAAETLGRFAGVNSERVRLLDIATNELSNEKLKSTYYRGFFEEWIKQDVNEALGYINQMPTSPALDTTIHDFVVGTGALLDPDVMMEWANTIFDEELKASAVKHATEAMKFNKNGQN